MVGSREVAERLHVGRQCGGQRIERYQFAVVGPERITADQ